LQVDQLTGTTVGRYRLRGRLQLLPYASIHQGESLDGGGSNLLWIFGEPYSGALGFQEALQRLAGDPRARGLAGVAQTLEIGGQELPSPLTFLVNEDVPGGFLVSLLQQGRAPGVLATVGTLAKTLDEVHRRGLVHGDVQPATVAVGRTGAAVLVGMGIRTVVTRVNPHAAWLDATRGFRPPEGRTDPSPAADRYGLAALTYYLLVGRPPAPDGVIEPPSRIRGQLPPAVDDVLLRALAPNPAVRHPSAMEMAEELRLAVSGRRRAPAAPRPVVARPPVAQGSANHPWQPAHGGEPAAARTVALVPMEQLELHPHVRRTGGIVLLSLLVVVAAALLVLFATGRLYL
jgi:serine/threonine protein kinase